MAEVTMRLEFHDGTRNTTTGVDPERAADFVRTWANGSTEAFQIVTTGINAGVFDSTYDQIRAVTVSR